MELHVFSVAKSMTVCYWRTCYLSSEWEQPPLDVSPDVSLGDACQMFGNYVTFELTNPSKMKKVVGEVKLFSMLMNASADESVCREVPMTETDETRGDDRLFNTLIDCLEQWGLGLFLRALVCLPCVHTQFFILG